MAEVYLCQQVGNLLQPSGNLGKVREDVFDIHRRGGLRIGNLHRAQPHNHPGNLPPHFSNPFRTGLLGQMRRGPFQRAHLEHHRARVVRLQQ